MKRLDPNKVQWVVLHMSASQYGNVETFRNWHLDRGWDDIGYHWVITNCYPTYNHYKDRQPDPKHDGMIQYGRNEKWRGAHVSGHNWNSIGVCLTGGGGEFSSQQLLSAAKLCHQISSRFPSIIGVKGHYEFTSAKTCPEIDMDYFRTYILPLGVEDEVVKPIFDPTIFHRSSGM